MQKVYLCYYPYRWFRQGSRSFVRIISHVLYKILHDKPIQTCRAHSRTAVGCLSLFPRFSNRYPTTDLPGTAGSADAGNSRRPENRPAAGVDPLYSRTAPGPPPRDTLRGSPWLYADTELEAWRLHLMRQRVKEARLRVRYPGNYYEPSNRAYFRIPASDRRTLPEVGIAQTHTATYAS